MSIVMQGPGTAGSPFLVVNTTNWNGFKISRRLCQKCRLLREEVKHSL